MTGNLDVDICYTSMPSCLMSYSARQPTTVFFPEQHLVSRVYLCTTHVEAIILTTVCYNEHKTNGRRAPSPQVHETRIVSSLGHPGVTGYTFLRRVGYGERGVGIFQSGHRVASVISEAGHLESVSEVTSQSFHELISLASND